MAAALRALFLAAAALFQLRALLGSWGDLTSLEPWLQFDYTEFWHFLWFAREAYAESGTIWGYDPGVHAGFSVGLLWMNQLPLQWLAAHSDFSLALLLKYAMATTVLAQPFCLYFAARLLRADAWPAAIGSAVAIWLAFSVEGAALLVVGHYLNIAVALLAILATAAAIRFCDDASPAAGLLLVMLPTLALFLHKSSGIVVALPLALVWLQAALRGLSLARHGAFAASALFALACNAWWLLVIWQNFGEYSGMSERLQFGGPEAIAMLQPWLGSADPSGSAVLRYSAILLGFPALFIFAFEKRYRQSVFVVVLLCALLAQWGQHLPFGKTLELYHLWYPCLLVLAFSAAASLARLFVRSPRLMFPAYAQPLRVALVLLPLGLAALALHLGTALAILETSPLGAREWPRFAELKAWISDSDAAARIAVEDFGYREDEPGMLHTFGPLFPFGMLRAQTGRMLLTGPYPYVFQKHWQSTLRSGQLFGRPLEEYSAVELKQLLRRYNVGSIACWSKPCKDAITALQADIAERGNIGFIDTYRMSWPANWVLQGGAARVQAQVNRITVSGFYASPRTDAPLQSDIPVLSFHYMPGMRSEPPGLLTPVIAAPDEVPLIGISNPVSDFVIRVP